MLYPALCFICGAASHVWHSVHGMTMASFTLFDAMLSLTVYA